MSSIKDDKNKKPKGPLLITKQSPKKVKLGSIAGQCYVHNDQSHIFWGATRLSRCFGHWKIQNAVKQK
jgi:hypothetical protein